MPHTQVRKASCLLGSSLTEYRLSSFPGINQELATLIIIMGGGGFCRPLTYSLLRAGGSRPIVTDGRSRAHLKMALQPSLSL